MNSCLRTISDFDLIGRKCYFQERLIWYSVRFHQSELFRIWSILAFDFHQGMHNSSAEQEWFLLNDILLDLPLSEVLCLENCSTLSYVASMDIAAVLLTSVEWFWYSAVLSLALSINMSEKIESNCYEIKTLWQIWCHLVADLIMSMACSISVFRLDYCSSLLYDIWRWNLAKLSVNQSFKTCGVVCTP